MAVVSNFDLAQQKQINYWHRLHLSTQISISIYVIIGCIYYVCWLVLWNIYYESSKAMIISDGAAFANTLLDQYAFNAEQVIVQSGLQLQQADNLFHLLITQNIDLPEPQACLMPSVICDSYASQYTYCYGWFAPNITNPQNLLDIHAMKFVSLLNMVVPMLDPTTAIFFSTSSDSLFFSNYPNQKFTDFNPHERAWFINNSAKIQQYPNNTFFSDPYIDKTTTSYYISEQKGLTIDQKYVGVIGQALNFQRFNLALYPFNQMNISITDLFGKLLLGDNNFFSINQIDNETGFSYSDFELIFNATFNQPYKSTCRKNFILSYNQLCLYNSQSQLDLIIKTRYLSEPKFIIILVYNPIIGEQIMKQRSENTFKTLIEYYQKDTLILTSSVIGLSITITLLIMYLLQTIRRIKKWTFHRIYHNLQFKKLYKQQSKQKQQYAANELIQLENAFQMLSKSIDDHQRQKCQQCRNMEAIQLPINIHNLEIRSQQYYFQNISKNYYLNQMVCVLSIIETRYKTLF